MKIPKTPGYIPMWYLDLAEEMVRNNISIREAAVCLELKITPEEADLLFKRQVFKDVLRKAKNRVYTEVANDPSRNKAVAIGQLVTVIDRLIAAGEDDKAAVAIEKLAKLEGWLSPDSNINVFAGLSNKDIMEARERLKAQVPLAKGNA